MSVTFSLEDTFSEDDLNVSNTNAWALLTALGIEPDYCGGIGAEDLLGRCLAVLVLPEGDLLDLPMDPASESLLEALGGPGGCHIEVLPRREGYIEERVAILADLARAGIAAGKEVQWC